jgi:hypothetical protein
VRPGAGRILETGRALTGFSMRYRGGRRGAAALGALVAAAAGCAAALVMGPIDARAQELQAPKLVVTIVVDQLRPDVLDRYSELYTGGLRRLLDEGHRFTQASHAHARTSTAPGHATLATGVIPARHGVVANTWFQRTGFTWGDVYAVADPEVGIVGFESEPLLPGRSPATLLRDGLPDWLADLDPDSRRVSVSRKDRAAIPMGGKRAQHVYWIVPELARFVTSTYYTSRTPRWVDRFNQREMGAIMDPEVWNTEVPEAERWRARPDSAAYEGDGVHTAFPHVSVAENRDTVRAQHYVWGIDQPRADDAVVAFARTAIDELDLGQRDALDYLSISLSATDRVGHAYGPFSQEVMSTVLHVDAVLGPFFDYLDDTVGEGLWVAGFSADHGVVTMPEWAREQGVADADRISRDSVRTALTTVLNDVARQGGSPTEIAERLADSAEQLAFVERAYTHHELVFGGAPADSFTVLYRNSYYPGRAWDDLSRYGVDLRYGADDYVGFPTGTNHETPYWYDRWVPMIFLGAGVDAGTSDVPVYTVDFAPTLAALAGIPVPADLDGRRVY